MPVVSSSSQTVELTARTALAGDFRKATAPRAAAKVRHPFAHSFVTRRARERATDDESERDARFPQANVSVVTEAKVKVAINGFGRIGA